ncbi:hypothetical protein ABZ682_22795 [Streptomyces griseoviridis]|uniref:hypothetical protein n=1 Tax=Streptomyces griseoviridis TaxID=45398 RepID=UPI00340025D7
MTEPYDETLRPFEPVRDAMLRLADLLEQNDPTALAQLSTVLGTAEFVTKDADQAVLAGILSTGRILTPKPGETNGWYAVRLREAVSG